MYQIPYFSCEDNDRTLPSQYFCVLSLLIWNANGYIPDVIITFELNLLMVSNSSSTLLLIHSFNEQSFETLYLQAFSKFAKFYNSTNILPSVASRSADRRRRSRPPQSVRRCRSVEPRSYYYRLVKAETASVTAAAVATEVDISTIAAAASYGWGRHGFLLCALSDFRGSPLPFSMALRRREGYQRRRSAASSIAEAAFAFASAAA